MTANVRWVMGKHPKALSNGVSFGMPWPRGAYFPGQHFDLKGHDKTYPVDSREIAYWADGSLKWTVHSISSHVEYEDEYVLEGSKRTQNTPEGVWVERREERIVVRSRHSLELCFQTGSKSVLDSMRLHKGVICTGATVVASIDGLAYQTNVTSVEVENQTSHRVVIKVSGVTVTDNSRSDSHLPFDLRFYVYSDSPSVKLVHSFIHDLNADQPLTSLGLRFSIPLSRSKFYNRHVRVGGSNGGSWKEEVQGLSGLRHGPTDQTRANQACGRPVILRGDEWNGNDLNRDLSYVPSWADYSLAQLSSDGFTLKKRTKPGCSWVKTIGGGRADGTAYVGSAEYGGLAVGMLDFWERYPTQIDLSDLDSHNGVITQWIYSPLAEPLDTSPYHDGLSLNSYSDQLGALNITYEDYEPGFATANGIGRTNVFFLKAYESTPSAEEFSLFSSFVRDPPRLLPIPTDMHNAGVFHGYWAPEFHAIGNKVTQKELDIERRLEFLFNFYHKQIEQNRWYGFWDHGDFQHSYDPFRHAWRYDVGGFAWDNSELSTDLWLWKYFLHTGRSDVFKVAEAMTRHTGEVDVYHAGKFKGFGTRHGVQHFSDSSKQLRISNVLYRWFYFFLTGDERTGDLITQQRDVQNSLLTLDSHRKVQAHGEIPDGFAMANIGLDCGSLAATWLTNWERRTNGWAHSEQLLVKLLEGISDLEHGIATNAILLNPSNGEIRPCPPPTPQYAISHLSMLFGFPEIIAELLDYIREKYPLTIQRFIEVWIPYCRAYNGGHEIQQQEYGFVFPPRATWRQSHSTLTAFAANWTGDESLAKSAWEQFFHSDGFVQSHEWSITQIGPPDSPSEAEEAKWISTNEAARYGVSAISNLANIRSYLA
ncbi:unnamed protein product [Penicillium salamii]|uniref:Uncharacterized protein n=1 Tax=Penicillium salamii TaxID=1612424 RepID=A0A9W4J5E2_9EURO|nr:unnamed protein product [Penicillium salamii]CAG8161010.1 unnamed protein product [Penicillium salamii]CAG8373407.1 unnamed protein product [Penicillium salamii]CAG8381162.1 unnamed protein product [Penicillium salamii]CAG8383062.1 unnamed protein product [Penicillium salamii]